MYNVLDPRTTSPLEAAREARGRDTAPTQAVIFCGGRGERLRPLTDQIPKPLAPVGGRPFLDYLCDQLVRAGVSHILLLAGYRGEAVESWLAARPRPGPEIVVVRQPAEWETGRRLVEVADLLDEEFLLLYGDNFAPFHLASLWERHRALGVPLTVTVAAKERGNIRLGEGRVAAYDPTRTAAGLGHVEIGYMIAERRRLLTQPLELGSFSRALAALAASGELGYFEPGCDYHSISDLDRLRRLEDHLVPRRILLIDRDGVINRKAPRGEYVTQAADFEWIDENVAGMRQLAARGFSFIVISNQAGIGRGIVTAHEVETLHGWMVAKLHEQGIPILDVLVCPHHWIDECRCRKPNPGLFFEAARRHGICLGRTIYLGDDPRDALAAVRATCLSALIGRFSAQELETVRPTRTAATVLDAAGWIEERFAAWETAEQGLSA